MFASGRNSKRLNLILLCSGQTCLQPHDILIIFTVRIFQPALMMTYLQAPTNQANSHHLFDGIHTVGTSRIEHGESSVKPVGEGNHSDI